MQKTDELVNTLVKAVDDIQNKKAKGYDTQATVTRIEGGTAYVHIPGGVDETPAQMTITAKKGDTVRVRVANGTAWLVGNATAPPTDDATANAAVVVANTATTMAGDAIESANIAAEAAESAKASAGEAKADAIVANQAASNALRELSTVENVVDTLEWITAHGTMTLTSDVVIDPSHVYFVVDPTGQYIVGGTHYSIVEEPKQAELSTYYELTIDDAVTNYVATHIVVDTEGLWIVPDTNNANRVLIAHGNGSTYTTAGTYIIGTGGVILAQFLANSAVIGENASGVTRTELSSGGMDVIRKTSSSTEETIAHLGYGEGAAQSGTANAPYFTLGTRRSGTVGNYSLAEGRDIIAGGFCAHGEGYYNNASGNASHSEGAYNTVIGTYAHAEGTITSASGVASHAEGRSTTASGDASHAEGVSTEASGDSSHAGGAFTVAGSSYQTAIGKYNDNKSGDLFEIGNGTSDSARLNVFEVDTSGNVNIKNGAKYKINGTALSASDVSALATADKYTRSAVGGLDWTTTTEGDSKVIMKSALAFWNGSYDGTTSNIQRLNGTVYIGGTQLQDFIKEKGTSSDWYYRKWNSGKVEAWRTYNAGSQTPSQWVTGWYYKDFTVAIPNDLFSSAPNTTIATNNGSDMQFMVFTARATSATSITVRVVKPNSGAATPVIALYVCNMV